MKARIIFLLVGLLCAAAFAQDGKSVSTGQPAGKNDKVYSTTQAQLTDPVAEAVKKRFQLRFNDLDITAVRRTPYGLFEVQLDGDMIYTDENVFWVMEGPLIDAATRRDITRENQEKLSAVSFADLPLNLAIKQVKGKGTNKVAIFEDPNCGYCKQLRHTLKDVDDVTIYTFLFPILLPDSTVKVRDVWCAADQGKAWDDWMLDGKRPATAQCDAPIDDMVALGRKLMVRGTPTIFFENGTRASGVLPLAQLQKRLAVRN